MVTGSVKGLALTWASTASPREHPAATRTVTRRGARARAARRRRNMIRPRIVSSGPPTRDPPEGGRRRHLATAAGPLIADHGDVLGVANIRAGNRAHGHGCGHIPLRVSAGVPRVLRCMADVSSTRTV